MLNSSLLTSPSTSFPAYTQEADELLFILIHLMELNDIQAHTLDILKTLNGLM